MEDIKESGVHMGFMTPIQSYILMEMGDKNLNQTNVRTLKGQGGVYISTVWSPQLFCIAIGDIY